MRKRQRSTRSTEEEAYSVSEINMTDFGVIGYVLLIKETYCIGRKALERKSLPNS